MGQSCSEHFSCRVRHDKHDRLTRHTTRQAHDKLHDTYLLSRKTAIYQFYIMVIPREKHLQIVPCWLSKKDVAIAHALIDAGFTYYGSFPDLNEDVTNSCPIETFHGGKLGVALGELVLSAFFDGALFNKPFKAETRQDFNREVESVKRVIEQGVNEWSSSHPQAVQLSLALV